MRAALIAAGKLPAEIDHPAVAGPASNVPAPMRIAGRTIFGGPVTNLTGLLEIQLGEGPAMITISILDGEVLLRTRARTMVVRPHSPNSILVTGQETPG